MENDAAAYMMEELRKCICSWVDYTELGLNLGLDGSAVQRIMNDNHHSILLAAYQVALAYYSGKTKGT